MTSLLLDTSTERGILSLAREGVVVAERELFLERTSSEQVLPAIDDIFTKNALCPKDLCYIAVGVGPGSYTGIRVGVALAKALSLACRVPLIGISGLYGFVPKEPYSGEFLSVLDARIGGMYVLEQRNMMQSEPKLLPLEAFIALLEYTRCLVTPSSVQITLRLQAKGVLSSLSIIERAPSADVLHRLAEKQFQDGKYSLDGELQILYLRQTQAEIEKGRLPNITF